MIDNLMRIATNEIGYAEEADKANKYGNEYGVNRVAWCVIFLWWTFKHAGISHLFYNGKKTAGCKNVYDWGVAEGLLVDKPEKGDIIVFTFGKHKDGTPIYSHVGICESATDKYITTIDGNTEGGLKVNMVARKKRLKTSILAIIRPKYGTKAHAEAQAKYDTYVVRKGDTLWGIAQKYYGFGAKYRKIYDYNKLSTTTIRIDQVLKIPKGV